MGACSIFIKHARVHYTSSAIYSSLPMNVRTFASAENGARYFKRFTNENGTNKSNRLVSYT